MVTWTNSWTVSSIRGGNALQIRARAGREGRISSSLSLAANTPNRVHTQLSASLAIEREFGMAHTTDRWEIKSTANT